MYLNFGVDNDEKLDGMCQKCRDEATSHTCSRCGAPLDVPEGESIVKNGDVFESGVSYNPNFDHELFEKMKAGEVVNGKILGDGVVELN